MGWKWNPTVEKDPHVCKTQKNTSSNFSNNNNKNTNSEKPRCKNDQNIWEIILVSHFWCFALQKVRCCFSFWAMRIWCTMLSVCRVGDPFIGTVRWMLDGVKSRAVTNACVWLRWCMIRFRGLEFSAVRFEDRTLSRLSFNINRRVSRPWKKVQDDDRFYILILIQPSSTGQSWKPSTSQKILESWVDLFHFLSFFISLFLRSTFFTSHFLIWHLFKTNTIVAEAV